MEQNKKKYERPTIKEEVIELDDVIATSGQGMFGNGNQDGDNSFSFNVFDRLGK